MGIDPKLLRAEELGIRLEIVARRDGTIRTTSPAPIQLECGRACTV